MADLPLTTFLEHPVVPYETDEVTRLILDTHDREAFAPLTALTVGGLRDLLLVTITQPGAAAALAAICAGLTPEMVAAVSKLMRNQDLIAVARAIEVSAAFRTTIGTPGTPLPPGCSRTIRPTTPRHRGRDARRPTPGLWRRGDRHQPGDRFTARHAGSAEAARRCPHRVSTSPPSRAC